MSDILESVTTLKTAQTEKAKSTQVQNNAGGFIFQITPEQQIRRFLILGTQGGTYYQGEHELTKDNASIVLDWAANHTISLVNLVTEISLAGRAPKQNPGIFALAAAAGLGDDVGRAYALAAVPKVCRTGTTLFTFAKYVQQFRGWGKGLRNAIADWYESKPADKAAFQMVKYRQREGWTHRDLLRKAHPAGASVAHADLYDWVTKGKVREDLPPIVNGFLAAQNTTNVGEWIRLINQYGLTWEMLPDVAMNEPKVWEAMLDKGVPMGALVRQLPRLTNLGVLTGPRLSGVLSQLTDQEAITKSRLHPLNILLAQTTYAEGHSVRGSSTWTPNTKIVDALSDAFYLAFGNVEPANKRTLNALDISGSMWGSFVKDSHLSAAQAAGAMSLVTLATEPEVQSVAFTSDGWSASSSRNSYSWYNAGITPVALSAKQRLDDVNSMMKRLSRNMGRTDCALPMIYAKENSLEIDTFIVSTDSETYAGTVHPFQALKDYRKASGIDARLVVVAYTSTGFSIADPDDSGMLDVVGLDSATPQLIADFSGGRL